MSYYILQIKDWILVCRKIQQGSRELGMVVNTSNPWYLSFQDHAFPLFLPFLAGDSGIPLALALIPRHFYEMGLPAALSWCLLWSSALSYCTLVLGENQKAKPTKLRNFSSPVWRLSVEQSKGTHFITLTFGKGKTFLIHFCNQLGFSLID